MSTVTNTPQKEVRAFGVNGSPSYSPPVYRTESLSPNELREKRQAKVAEARAIAQRAINEKREMTEDDRKKFDAIMAEVATIDESIKAILQIASVERPPGEGESAGRRSRPWLSSDYERRSGTRIGLDRDDVKRYSILRAVRAAMNLDWREAPFEYECSRATLKAEGRDARSPHSIFVPWDVLASPRRERRDLTIGTEGADVKQTTVESSWIELLRNKLIVEQAGATIMSGLQGDVLIPRQSGTSTAAWVAESGAASESTPTLDNVTLAYGCVSAWMDLSRKFLKQSSIDADAFAENDLSSVLALALDKACLHGSGSSNEPTGVAATAGIGSVAGGTDGAAPTWDHLVELETDVAVENADIGSLGFITNTKVRGKLRTTPMVASTDSRMIWETGNTILAYPAHVSNQVSSTLTKGSSGAVCSAIFFGNWADLLIGIYGNGLEIIVDPYSASTTGVVRVVGFLDASCVVRRPKSFSAMLDVLTA